MLACLSYAEKIIECYDFESQEWLFLTERPGCNYGSEAVYAGSKLYAIGGVQSKDVDSYDPETNEWNTETPLSQFRVAHGVVSDEEDNVIVVGGCAKSGAEAFGEGLKTMELKNLGYNRNKETWKTNENEMKEGRNFAGTCYSRHDGQIYTVGGCLTEASSTVEAFNPALGKWKTLPNTKNKRDSLGLLASPIGDIYAIGGYDNTSQKYLKTVERFSMDSGTWKSLKSRMELGRRKPGVVQYRGRMYVVAGMGQNKDLNCVQVLNPLTEQWEPDFSPPPLAELCGNYP